MRSNFTRLTLFNLGLWRQPGRLGFSLPCDGASTAQGLLIPRSDLPPPSGLGCRETVRVTTVRGIIVGFLKLSSSMASPAASSNTRSDNGEK
jgi:hypothetical protein